jgi:hypothetical protein
MRIRPVSLCVYVGELVGLAIMCACIELPAATAADCKGGACPRATP